VAGWPAASPRLSLPVAIPFPDMLTQHIHWLSVRFALILSGIIYKNFFAMNAVISDK
jgi:hypothetical protein